ncbi:hypothetical protein EK21DRAFT_93190 [Setomelanomma holmii]|uniref:F-box domain-containing protein n=1 Tax=Setomelanomma holmii TaxID=210430 RepID=A0A9P4LHI0_9PLEO|nr:hypothetical protein EK21DRAFT_93190 [Setomelanomma holmii]
MSQHDQFPLLELPAELRLEIFRHLVIDCLSCGSASDLAGLYLSCREIHNALKENFITKVQPLLRTKHEWREAGYGSTPIRLELNGPAQLSVTMPILESCLPIRSLDTERYPFWSLVDSLQQTICLRWQTLTLSFVHHSKFTRSHQADRSRLVLPLRTGAFSMGDEVYHFTGLLTHLEVHSASVPFAFQNIDRLVLVFEEAEDEIVFALLWQFFLIMRRMAMFRPDLSRELRNGWICKMHEGTEYGYNLVLDYEPHLEEPERVQWRISVDGSSFRALRKSVSSDELVVEAEFNSDDDS